MFIVMFDMIDSSPLRIYYHQYTVSHESSTCGSPDCHKFFPLFRNHLKRPSDDAKTLTEPVFQPLFLTLSSADQQSTHAFICKCVMCTWKREWEISQTKCTPTSMHNYWNCTWCWVVIRALWLQSFYMCCMECTFISSFNVKPAKQPYINRITSCNSMSTALQAHTPAHSLSLPKIGKINVLLPRPHDWLLNCVKCPGLIR